MIHAVLIKGWVNTKKNKIDSTNPFCLTCKRPIDLDKETAREHAMTTSSRKD
jgi:hypothetical protein